MNLTKLIFPPWLNKGLTIKQLRNELMNQEIRLILDMIPNKVSTYQPKNGEQKVHIYLFRDLKNAINTVEL